MVSTQVRSFDGGQLNSFESTLCDKRLPAGHHPVGVGGTTGLVELRADITVQDV